MKKGIILFLLLLTITACNKKEEEKVEELKTDNKEQKEPVTEPVIEKDQVLTCNSIIDSDYYYMNSDFIFTFDAATKKVKNVSLTESRQLTGDAELGASLISELKSDCNELSKEKGVTCSFSLSSDEKTAIYKLTYDINKMESDEIDVFDSIKTKTIEGIKKDATDNDITCTLKE